MFKASGFLGAVLAVDGGAPLGRHLAFVLVAAVDVADQRDSHVRWAPIQHRQIDHRVDIE